MLDLLLFFLLLVVAADELVLLGRVLGVALDCLVAEGTSKQGLVLARDDMLRHFFLLLRLIPELSSAGRRVGIIDPRGNSR